MTILNLQVGTNNDDGYVGGGPFGTGLYQPAANMCAVGWSEPLGNGSAFGTWIRFTGVSSIRNAIINAANLEVYLSNKTGSNFESWVSADDRASPTRPLNWDGFLSLTRTTASSTIWTGSGSLNTWIQSPSLINVVQELADTHNLTALQLLHDGPSSGSGDHWFEYRSRNYDSNLAPKLTIDYTPSNTPPTITVAPSVNYNGYTRLGPNNTPGSVGFTATDAEETGANELSYQIRTASGSGGTLVASGNFTSGVAANVNIAHNASGINEGSNTLYLRVSDGTDFAPTNPSFTLLVDRSAPTVGTITHNPDPVIP